MQRRCNLRQVDILLMTCLLTLTGHYWLKGDDGWESSNQTIFHPREVIRNKINIFEIDIDIHMFKKDHIDIAIFQKCQYIDNQYLMLIYQTGLFRRVVATAVKRERPAVEEAKASYAAIEKVLNDGTSMHCQHFLQKQQARSSHT